MRTIDATLQTALATGHFTPYIKLRQYRNGTQIGDALQVSKYKLTGTHLSVTVNGQVVVSSTPDAVKLILDRGIISNGTNYLLSTSKFTPLTGTIEKLTPRSLNISTSIEASLIPPKFITFAGDVTYAVAIAAFCSLIGKNPVLKVPGAAYWQYQFLPAGKTVTFNNANNFLALLRQKYFIFCCDAGNEDILFYQAFDIPGSQDANITSILANIGTGFFQKRRYFAKDEVSALRYAGSAGDVLHNLGFLPAAASLPSRYTQYQPVTVQLPLNLNYMDGDFYYIDNSYWCHPSEVTEVFDPKASPGWSVYIRQLEYFTNTEGGALPSTIERVSNYTPLNVSNFNNNLDATCNNLQAFADRVDDMSIAGGHAAVSIDGTNGHGLSVIGQVLSLGLASAGVTGALSGTDWSTFNNKQAALVAADASHNGYLTSTDWTTFNNKQNALMAADGSHDGYLTMANWTTFNAKLSDAPSDGTNYGRKNGAWTAIAAGGGDVYLANANVFTAKQTVQGLNAAGLNEMLKLYGGATGASGPSMAFYDWYGSGAYPTWRLAEIGAVYNGGSYGADLIFNVNSGATATSQLEVLRITRAGLATFVSEKVNGVLSVVGSADAVQLSVKGFSTQTNVLQSWLNNAGTPVATLDVTGALSSNVTLTNTSGTLYGHYANLSFTPSGSSSANIKGFFSGVTSLGAQNITGLTAGLQGYVQHNGSGTLDLSYGLLFSADNINTGTVTSLIGAQVSVSNTNASGVVGTATALSILALVNAGTITTAYGLKVGNVAGAGTNYAIYTGTGLVRFGDVLLPVQAPTASAPTYVKGGIYFDTTLNKLRVGGATAWETITSA